MQFVQCALYELEDVDFHVRSHMSCVHEKHVRVKQIIAHFGFAITWRI